MGESRKADETVKGAETARTGLPTRGSRFATLVRLQGMVGNRATAQLIQRLTVSGQGPRVRVQRDARHSSSPRDSAVAGFHGDGKHRPTDWQYASKLGKQDAEKLSDADTLSSDEQAELNAKLAWFKGRAHDVYLNEIKPALMQTSARDRDKSRHGWEQDVHDMYGTIQGLRYDRIVEWAENAKIPASKVGEELLVIVIAIASEGLGGIVYGVMHEMFEGRNVNKYLREFSELAGLEAGDLAAEAVFRNALGGVRGHFEQAREAASKAIDGDMALVSKRGTLAAYAEAMRLQTRTEQHFLEHNFNQEAKGLTEHELRVEYALLEVVYEELKHHPDEFMRTLTTGYIRLLDEAMLAKKKKDYGGSRESTFSGDPEAHASAAREGNLVVEPRSTSQGLGTHGLGSWEDPDLSFDVQVQGTGVNPETLEWLLHSQIAELPLTLSFQGLWAIGPYGTRGEPSDVSIWFVRDPEDRIYLDYVSGADKWLTSYYTREGHEHSETERRKYAPLGARKLYEAIKHKTIDRVQHV